MSAPLCFDLETIGTDAAMAAPYPKEKRNPPSNYSKPEAIAKWYEKDELEWRADRSKECALSPRLGRIVTIGWALVDQSRHDVGIAESEDDEHLELCRAWDRIAEANGQIIGFNSLAFDVPFFLCRSLVHGITPTVPVKTVRDWTRRYSYGPHYDVRAVLTQWDNRTTGTLTDWCSAFGIPCDDKTKGSDIYELYLKGDFDAIAAHCRADVEVTAKLYERTAQMYGGIETPRWRDVA